MNYAVQIQVTPPKGRKLTITQNVKISHDSERNLYKAKTPTGKRPEPNALVSHAP